MTDKSSLDVLTFGCRLNIFESEVMRRQATEAGLEDAVIINTCSVTNEAERQARQAIRRARRDHPHKKIIVTGCSAQLTPQVYEAMEEVDFILGNQEKLTVEAYKLAEKPKAQVNDIMAIKEGASHLVASFENHVRAFIEIQNGCNHRCTFCTIPFSRGPHRSVPAGFLVQQIKDLVSTGIQEVVLTGVDITDYGQDLPGTPSLSNLVQRLLKLVPDLPRLRLSSLDPKEIDADMIRLFQTEKRLMPHVHLSLQSGDAMILKRMKRRHSPEDAVEVVKALKTVRPTITFGADIIAGFPTETDDMARNTLKHLQACDITYLHVFPYSSRKDTPAARMPQVAKAKIQERAKELRDWSDLQLHRFLHSQIGKTVHVLIEKNGEGRTQEYAPVTFKDSELIKPFVGKIINVDVIGVLSKKLLGNMIKD